MQLKHETLNIGTFWDDIVSFFKQDSCARIDQKSRALIKFYVESAIENAMENDEFKNKTPAEKVKFFRDALRKADPTFSLSEPKPGAVINTMDTERRHIFMCMDQLIDESLEEREFRKKLKDHVEKVNILIKGVQDATDKEVDEVDTLAKDVLTSLKKMVKREDVDFEKTDGAFTIDFNNKIFNVKTGIVEATANFKEAVNRLVEKHKPKSEQTIEDLLKLPGPMVTKYLQLPGYV